MNAEREIFGSFVASASEFAISAEYIQEVVNPPEKYISLPLAPAYLLGLFNLRGTVIPVIDLKKYLNLSSLEVAVEQKIAILELDNLCIGLLFDHTAEVFYGKPEERSDFSSSSANSVIQGVFKKENGKRLIQILDVPAIFAIQAVPRDQNQVRSGQRHNAHHRGFRKQCISFAVGAAKCALGIGEIQEIIKVDQVTNSALAVGPCIGVIDLRGTTVPVIDFAFLLGYRELDESGEATKGERRVIVLRLDGELFGLLVDLVDSIVSYYEENVRQFSAFVSSKREMFSGCISKADADEILLLDYKNILSNGEIQEITHGHSRIYRASQSHTLSEGEDSGLKRTFITFKVDQVFAVPIGEVKEVIEMPSQLLQPPGLPSYCKGVLNLRGELVSIIDARELYQANAALSQLPQKVLIFKMDSILFGLVVDTVEAIVSISDANKIKLPEILFKSLNGMSDDVSEAIQCKDTGGKEINMLILKAQSIGSRLLKSA
jgi:purine-binding chemotaxis protein CheW